MRRHPIYFWPAWPHLTSDFGFTIAWDTAFQGNSNLAPWAILAVTTSKQFRQIERSATRFLANCVRAINPKA